MPNIIITLCRHVFTIGNNILCDYLLVQVQILWLEKYFDSIYRVGNFELAIIATNSIVLLISTLLP